MARLPGAAVVAAAYLAGTVPVAQALALVRAGVDLRQVGSGTVSGTGLYEVAGFGPLAVAGAFELAKGALGPLLAGRDRPLIASIAGAAAVVGHNWSPFLGLAGGRGIGVALGASLVTHVPAALALGTGMAAGRMAGQTGLGSTVGIVLVPVSMARRLGGPGSLTGVALVAPMLIKRLAGNVPPPRERRARRHVLVQRLLFDRDGLPCGPAAAGRSA